MAFKPVSEELVEIEAQFSEDLIKELDVLLRMSGEILSEKARSQLIEDILNDWYRRELQGPAK